MNNNLFYTYLPLNLIYDKQYSTLSLKAIVLYALILNRVKLSDKNKRFQDGGGTFVYYSTVQICEHLRCGKNSARNTLKELEEAGLIRKEYQSLGLPIKIYVCNRIFNNSKLNSTDIAEKEVSFDVEKAERKADEGTTDFGEMKIKKRRKH